MNIEELIESYDWQEAFKYAPFNIEDVEGIVASEDGENDGESWVGVFKLSDGRYGFLEAGCDYTGWDCQAGGSGYTADTLEDLRRNRMTSSARRRLDMAIPDLDDIPNKPA